MRLERDVTQRRAPLWARIWELEHRRAVLWLPVLMGVGIWAYFALPDEPPAWLIVLPVAPILPLVSGWARRHGAGALVFLSVLCAVTSGFALALWSAHRVAAPMIETRMAETVEGRVIGLSRSASGAPRALMDRVVVFGLDRAETPDRLRITFLGLESPPAPGSRLRVYATLLPPGAPVEPGAFDFRRRAYFEGLGGVGYTHTTPLVVPGAEQVGAGPEPDGLDQAAAWLTETRMWLADQLRAEMPGAPGAFAAAIAVGDRSGIDDADAEALRVSTLAHLLAISGLHMGILTGLVFAAARFGIALTSLSLRVSGKKVAAVAALIAGVAYLGLSGATVATQRAFVMVAVALVAVLLDRPAISLRALALAAAILLAIRPISLMDVGFQMSFAATAALVAGYEVLRDRLQAGEEPDRRSTGWAWSALRTVGVYAGGLLMTSLLAGLATAPFAAFHFNRVGAYGLVANLGAVPAMGLVIAPAGIAAALAAPFGLAIAPLAVMGWGIEWVLSVAHGVAGLPGAARMVAAAHPAVLACLGLGGLWLAIWRGPWRLLGAGGIAAGLILWVAASPPRPDLLIAPEARLIGLMGPRGRALDHERAQSFAAESWLRRDGDLATQEEAAARPGLTRQGRVLLGTLPHGWEMQVLRSRKLLASDIAALCQSHRLIIAPSGPAHRGACVYLVGADLQTAIAIHALSADELQVTRSTNPGSRLWSAASSVPAE